MLEKKKNITPSLSASKSMRENNKKQAVLLVEKSSLLRKAIGKIIDSQSGYSLYSAANPTEGLKLMQENHSFSAAIVDCEFPGDGHSQLMDMLVEEEVAVIALASDRKNGDYEELWQKGVFDIISNDDPRCTQLVVKALGRLLRNSTIKVLLVDDSATFRCHLKQLLTNQRYIIIEAKNGIAGLEMIQIHPDIQIIVTDYDMPVMDGFEMIRAIREERCEDELVIIGFSGREIKYLGARFLKYGANDFIQKQNFVREEFYYRLNIWADNQQLVKDLKKSGITDPLTGLYTQDYLYDYGAQFDSQVGNLTLACAFVEVDYLAMLNEGFGYDVGNVVVKNVAGIIKRSLPEDNVCLLARIGGPRFCILFSQADAKSIFQQLDGLRESVAKTSINQGLGEEIEVTVSIGCCVATNVAFTKLLEEALELLGHVINASGNAVIVRGHKSFYKTKGLPSRIDNLLSAQLESPSLKQTEKLYPSKSKRVLLVDDSKVIKKIVAGFLKRLGVEHEEAKNGKEGLEKLRSADFDLVFFDISMPILNGIKAAAIARKEFPKLFIVMLTAEHTMVEEATRIGVDGYLTKPFNFKMICNCLADLGLI